MALEDIVNVTVSNETTGVSQQGFGIPLVLSPHVQFADLVRTYTQASQLLDDGFTVTSPEYLMISRLFGQDRKPDRVLLGKRNLRPTQRFAWTPTAANNAVYKLRVGNVVATYTSDANATVTEIIAGMLAVFTPAAAELGLTFSDQTTYLRILANSPGQFIAVENLSLARASLKQDQADPGVVTDLAAVALEDPSFFAVLNLFNSQAEIEAIAGWAETNKRLFIAQTSDNDVHTNSTTDVMSTQEALARQFTSIIFAEATDSFADAAWAGRGLPTQPGSETWNLKQLRGVMPTKLTAGQKAFIAAKSGNYFELVAGRGITTEGKVSSGAFIDNVRGVEWFVARLRERIFGTLSSVDKVPYDNRGAAVIQGDMLAQVSEGIGTGFIADSPEPVVTVPDVQTMQLADRQARYLTGAFIGFTTAGAIHRVRVNIRISV